MLSAVPGRPTPGPILFGLSFSILQYNTYITTLRFCMLLRRLSLCSVPCRASTARLVKPCHDVTAPWHLNSFLEGAETHSTSGTALSQLPKQLNSASEAASSQMNDGESKKLMAESMYVSLLADHA